MEIIAIPSIYDLGSRQSNTLPPLLSGEESLVTHWTGG
jgi:hypothetical protein